MKSSKKNTVKPNLKTMSYIFLGPGGVGKTSCSTAYAMSLAKEGKKVALLSIDPAKRLARGLNLKLGSEMLPIDLGEASQGELYAAMLDQKTVFDQMIEKYAKKQKTRQKIYAHPLYIAASEKLSGPLEYMAVAKFFDLVSSKKYDAVILDTPPDVNALDFLARPNVLGAFMDLGIIKILLKPIAMANRFGLSKLLSAGESTIAKIAKLTGIDALNILVEFMVLCQDVIKGFNEVAQATKKIFNSPECRFVYVSRLENRCMRSLKFMDHSLNQMGFKASACFFAKVPTDKAAKRSPFHQQRNEHMQGIKDQILGLFPNDFIHFTLGDFSGLAEPLDIVTAMSDEIVKHQKII